MFVILVLIIFFVLQGVAFFTLLERHVLGLSQNRYGPKKNRLLGLIQPLLDGIKLINKEQILMFNCSSVVFLLVTVFNFIVLYIEYMVLCYYFFYLSINFGYLMLIILMGLNLICLLIGGIYSKSKYSYLGGIRCVIASVSYEIQFNLNLLLFMLYIKSFILVNIGNLGLIVFFFTFFFSLLVELGRTPFDYSESESDLVSGFNTEYSSIGFVLIFLKEYGSLLFFSFFMITVFAGGYFIFGVLIFYLIIIVRRSYPRFRMDKLISLMWIIMFFHVCFGLWSSYCLLSF